jgi:hypothetical protein
MGKAYPVHHRRAMFLVTSYPNRFTIQKGVYTMPAIPPETHGLPNGQHLLIVESHKETKSQQYGQLQEELTCIRVETGERTRIWISHNSREKILNAISAGVAVANGDNWEILDGAQFYAISAGGKVVTLLPITAAAPGKPAGVVPPAAGDGQPIP